MAMQYSEELSKNLPRAFSYAYTGASQDVLEQIMAGASVEEATENEMNAQLMGEYGDLLGGMSIDDLLSMDPDAVEKAAYQLHIRTKRGGDFEIDGMMTPWGSGLSEEDVQTIALAYPGIEDGLDMNDIETHFGDAEQFLGRAGLELDDLMDAGMQRAEDEGRLDDLGDLFRGLGDQVGLSGAQRAGAPDEAMGQMLGTMNNMTDDLQGGTMTPDQFDERNEVDIDPIESIRRMRGITLGEQWNPSRAPFESEAEQRLVDAINRRLGATAAFGEIPDPVMPPPDMAADFVPQEYIEGLQEEPMYPPMLVGDYGEIIDPSAPVGPVPDMAADFVPEEYIAGIGEAPMYPDVPLDVPSETSTDIAAGFDPVAHIASLEAQRMYPQEGGINIADEPRPDMAAGFGPDEYIEGLLEDPQFPMGELTGWRIERQPELGPDPYLDDLQTLLNAYGDVRGLEVPLVSPVIPRPGEEYDPESYQDVGLAGLSTAPPIMPGVTSGIHDASMTLADIGMKRQPEYITDPGWYAWMEQNPQFVHSEDPEEDEYNLQQAYTKYVSENRNNIDALTFSEFTEQWDNDPVWDRLGGPTSEPDRTWSGTGGEKVVFSRDGTPFVTTGGQTEFGYDPNALENLQIAKAGDVPAEEGAFELQIQEAMRKREQPPEVVTLPSGQEKQNKIKELIEQKGKSKEDANKIVEKVQNQGISETEAEKEVEQEKTTAPTGTPEGEVGKDPATGKPIVQDDDTQATKEEVEKNAEGAIERAKNFEVAASTGVDDIRYSENLVKKFYEKMYSIPGAGNTDVQSQLESLFGQTTTLFFLHLGLQAWDDVQTIVNANDGVFDMTKFANVEEAGSTAINNLEGNYAGFLNAYMADPFAFRSGARFQERLRRVNEILTRESDPAQYGLPSGWSAEDQADHIWIKGLFGGDDDHENRMTLITMAVTGGGQGYYSRQIQQGVYDLMGYYRNTGSTESEIFRKMTDIFGGRGAGVARPSTLAAVSDPASISGDIPAGVDPSQFFEDEDSTDGTGGEYKALTELDPSPVPPTPAPTPIPHREIFSPVGAPQPVVAPHREVFSPVVTPQIPYDPYTFSAFNRSGLQVDPREEQRIRKNPWAMFDAGYDPFD